MFSIDFRGIELFVSVLKKSLASSEAFVEKIESKWSVPCALELSFLAPPPIFKTILGILRSSVEDIRVSGVSDFTLVLFMTEGSIICIPSWAVRLPTGTKIRLIGKLVSINTQKRTFILSHQESSIIVNFSLLTHFQDFIGEIYEIYGTLEKSENQHEIFCSALLANFVEGADMKLIQESLVIFNRATHPKYENIFN